MLSALAALPPSPQPATLPVFVPSEGGKTVRGDVIAPSNPIGMVVFARGRAQYRDYPHDMKVSRIFAKYGLATLLADLGAPEDGADIRRLAREMDMIARWVKSNPSTSRLPVGFFGIGTDAAAAMRAACFPDSPVEAIVARDGRCDKVADILPALAVPVLLVAGGNHESMRISKEALGKIKSQTSFNVIPNASRSFDNADAVEDAAQLAALWFVEYLVGFASA